jgi:ATP-dependent DNA helicase RecG
MISINFTPAFGRRGKGKTQLFNATCVVKDLYSEKYLNLKWFNTYPSLKKQIEAFDSFSFMGAVSEYNGTLQIVNPKINPKVVEGHNQMLIEYPTVNSVSGNNLKKIIDKVPDDLWNQSSSIIPEKIESSLNLKCINESLKIIHGKINSNKTDIDQAKDRLIYEEFFKNQLSILARKMKYKKLKAPQIKSSKKDLEQFKKFFPYELTTDQNQVIEHIKNDFSSSLPMMRMIQGDVGCGKTTVALISALMVIKNGGQVALMCPTEALAIQHTKTISSLINKEIKMELLIGSTKLKDKNVIYQQLVSGEINLIIGTHSLIQKAVEFSNLQLAIIDEQHKFGVEQRQTLIKKGSGVHTLIMTATPIPRTLQLAQYGDLDISTIRVMPGGRKGIKTRIVTPETYEKYLSFIKTRMSIGEQIYIVVPAIEESEVLALQNVNSLIHTYKKYFPEYKIEALHGQLKSDEKAKIMNDFADGKIQLLISTTVIEVGINVLNSTVISIYNPDRFGLSSLHQLRGRVGRGEKAGFCFLITDKDTAKDALGRIRIVEKTIDGFEIAEADLLNRGQGDLFGANQSGHISSFRLGNIVQDFPIFEKVSQDIQKMKETNTEYLNNELLKLLNDTKVSSTI